MFIDITWSELLPQDEPIEVDELEAAVPGFRWRQVYSSGRTVKPPSDLALLALWEARGTSAFTSSATYMEGLPVSSTTMRYERSRAARDRCIALHGHTCSICAFEFATTYGALGEGYVHVHHVVPLSARGQQDTVDPANDLVPVCANCHVMLHRSRSATDPSRIMTPAEMRAALPIPAAPR
ncbi:HNH endonuclease [Klenkia soli]|uniref:HNH endonuclease n=1 Tax=Klenkia soli TaxID=1052260 RepID=UPI0013F4C075|nr:HNH endonuclease [Klenkia soli]